MVYIHLQSVYVFYSLPAELRLVVLGQTSAACTMLGLPEIQNGEFVTAKHTRQAAGKKAISLSFTPSLLLSHTLFSSFPYLYLTQSLDTNFKNYIYLVLIPKSLHYKNNCISK